MEQTLQYGEEKIIYNILPRSKILKKIRIHVHPNCRVDVEVPEKHKIEEIKIAIQKRARWISRQLEMIKKNHEFSLPREFVSGETHFYIGKRYQLKVMKTTNEPSSVKLKGGSIIIKSRTNDPAAIRRRLTEWYSIKAENYFLRRIDEVSKKISWLENIPSIKLVKMKKQWGSCSPTDVIHLNPCLIKASTACIDYVIVHEICHIKERNHSKNYYSLLERHYPEWKKVKQRLDEMAELYLAN